MPEAEANVQFAVLVGAGAFPELPCRVLRSANCCAWGPKEPSADRR
jgi:hypothetical protein